jgi:hypothetical protein
MTAMIAFVSIFMLIHYFFSDKLVLMTMGAKIVFESVGRSSTRRSQSSAPWPTLQRRRWSW